MIQYGVVHNYKKSPFVLFYCGGNCERDMKERPLRFVDDRNRT